MIYSWPGQLHKLGQLIVVFGGDMAAAKIQTVKGLRVDFFAPAKKFYWALRVWIGGTA